MPGKREEPLLAACLASLTPEPYRPVCISPLREPVRPAHSKPMEFHSSDGDWVRAFERRGSMLVQVDVNGGSAHRYGVHPPAAGGARSDALGRVVQRFIDEQLRAMKVPLPARVELKMTRSDHEQLQEG